MIAETIQGNPFSRLLRKYQQEIEWRTASFEEMVADVNGAGWRVARVQVEGEPVVVDINAEAGFAQVYNVKDRAWWAFPAAEEAVTCLQAHGLTTARVFAQLYAVDAGGNPLSKRSLTAIMRKPTERNEGRLHLAVFDLYEHTQWLARGRPAPYLRRFEQLPKMFGGCERIHPMAGQVLPEEGGQEALRALWAQVQAAGGPGIVMGQDRRGFTDRFVAVEPRTELNAAVIGYTVGTGQRAGRVGSLALALRDTTGKYLYLGRVSHGLTAEERDQWQSLLSEQQRLPRRRTLTGVSGPKVHLTVPGPVITVEAKRVREHLQPALFWNTETTQWEPMGKRSAIAMPSMRFVGLRPDLDARRPADVAITQAAVVGADDLSRLLAFGRRLGITEEFLRPLAQQALEPDAMTLDQRRAYMERLWKQQQMEGERERLLEAEEFLIPTDVTNGEQFGRELGRLQPYLRKAVIGMGAPAHAADDIVGLTILKALEAWEGKRKRPTPGRPLRPWLLRVLRNTYIDDYLRKMKHRKRWEDVERAKGALVQEGAERMRLGARGGRVRAGAAQPGVAREYRYSTVRP